MIPTTRPRHAYDHRLRDLVRSTGNIEHATRRGVPRSTARGWLSARRARLVTLDVADQDHRRLQHEVLALRRRLDRLLALLRLMVVLWKVSGFSLSGLRFPDPASRLRLLQAIDRAHAVLPLRAVLRQSVCPSRATMLGGAIHPAVVMTRSSARAQRPINSLPASARPSRRW